MNRDRFEPTASESYAPSVDTCCRFPVAATIGRLRRGSSAASANPTVYDRSSYDPGRHLVPRASHAAHASGQTARVPILMRDNVIRVITSTPAVTATADMPLVTCRFDSNANNNSPRIPPASIPLRLAVN
jgi:hypothetical protein